MLKNKKILGLICVLILLAVYYIFSSENKDPNGQVLPGYNPDSIPSVTTDSVTMLISDSGIYKYKIITEKWLIFSDIKDPFWLFPEKLLLEQFDTIFQVIATIKADSVWNYTNRKLWKLRGNVEVRNIQEEVFLSNELYWDERRGRFFSNAAVEIVRPNKISLRGNKFESNQDMTEYSFTGVHDTDVYVHEKEQNESEMRAVEDIEEETSQDIDDN